MGDARSRTGVTAEKITWVVLCSTAAGTSGSEYVEGTDLVRDDVTGALRILDGGRLVREYDAGAWANFCEWVCDYTDFFSGTVIRLSSGDDSRQLNRPDATRALATAMAMDTTSAMALFAGSLPHPRKSSESDGAVRTSARLPGPRHA